MFMNAVQRQNWEQTRTEGHTRFIFRYGLIQSGVPFAVIVVAGCLLFDFFRRTPYTPLLLPWPVWNEAAEFLILAFAYGYLRGESEWRRREKDFSDDLEGAGVIARPEEKNP